MIYEGAASIFSDEFELAGRRHRLVATPENVIPSHVKQRLEFRAPVGAVLLEAYTRGAEIFVRLYHVASGEFAWYLSEEATAKQETT